jgi:sulfur relay (sulfurtransferase) DsrC/TusE family protein
VQKLIEEKEVHGDHDAYPHHETSQDEVVQNVMAKQEELNKIHSDIIEHQKTLEMEEKASVQAKNIHLAKIHHMEK